MDGVTVAVVASRTEAELIVGLLRSNGLRADVSADDAAGLDPQLQLQGVRVLVAPADETQARRLLADAGTAGPLTGSAARLRQPRDRRELRVHGHRSRPGLRDTAGHAARLIRTPVVIGQDRGAGIPGGR